MAVEVKAGKKTLKNREIELHVNGTKIASTNAHECIRSLGIHLGPSVQWKTQFQVMKEKMKESVCKIKAMVIFPSTARVFYNVCLCTKVYFGCGNMALTPQQE